ncbi:MAG: nitroreductase family protein, partial [Tateyamaria sp.]
TGGFVPAFCLAAQALGVATIPQAAIAAQAPFVRTHFDIADDRQILCAISFGYADPDHPANGFRTDRASIADVVKWRE